MFLFLLAGSANRAHPFSVLSAFSAGIRLTSGIVAIHRPGDGFVQPQQKESLPRLVNFVIVDMNQRLLVSPSHQTDSNYLQGVDAWQETGKGLSLREFAERDGNTDAPFRHGSGKRIGRMTSGR
jgi:hypothetical protein